MDILASVLDGHCKLQLRAYPFHCLFNILHTLSFSWRDINRPASRISKTCICVSLVGWDDASAWSAQAAIFLQLAQKQFLGLATRESGVPSNQLLIVLIYCYTKNIIHTTPLFYNPHLFVLYSLCLRNNYHFTVLKCRVIRRGETVYSYWPVRYGVHSARTEQYMNQLLESKKNTNKWFNRKKICTDIN